jgi:hypothetical protein
LAEELPWEAELAELPVLVELPAGAAVTVNEKSRMPTMTMTSAESRIKHLQTGSDAPVKILAVLLTLTFPDTLEVTAKLPRRTYLLRKVR